MKRDHITSLKDLIAEPALLSQRALCSIRSEVSHIQLCSNRSIECGGQTFRPDKDTAYVEFFLSHAFPVTTCDGTALHPQVVANSYQTMLNKVFDFNHIIKQYDPRHNPVDRNLGTIVAVEFPAVGNRSTYYAGDQAYEEFSDGKWKVQGDRSKAPGIRAVAVMHKQLEMVPKILDGELLEALAGPGREWMVSMEQEWVLGNSGFLIKAPTDDIDFGEGTPEDIARLGYAYCSAQDAPLELLKCLDQEQAKITKNFRGLETIILFGGLDGTVHYYGVGLTPAGKEDEAVVRQMLASQTANSQLPIDKQPESGIAKLLRETAGVWEG
jgi:hypothetical protein